MKLSEVIAGAPEAIRLGRIARMAQGFDGLLSTVGLFEGAGLTSGKIRFSESAEDSNLYALEVEVIEPAPGMTAEETEAKFRSAVDDREFADDLTVAGHGEFFNVDIDFATFRGDFIRPVVLALVAEGVEID